MDPCTDEGTLLSLACGSRGCSVWVQEVRFMVKPRILGGATSSRVQLVLDLAADGSPGGLGSSYGVGGGAQCGHPGRGLLLSEHKDRKSTKEKKWAGRAGNTGF